MLTDLPQEAVIVGLFALIGLLAVVVLVLGPAGGEDDQ